MIVIDFQVGVVANSIQRNVRRIDEPQIFGCTFVSHFKILRGCLFNNFEIFVVIQIVDCVNDGFDGLHRVLRIWHVVPRSPSILVSERWPGSMRHLVN